MFIKRQFWTPQTPTRRSDDLLTVWWSTGTWFTSLPSSPPSPWSSSTSTPLGWSTTSERFWWTFWFASLFRDTSQTFQELYKGSGQGEDVETIARLRAEMLEQERQVKIDLSPHPCLTIFLVEGGSWEAGVPWSTSCPPRKRSLLVFNSVLKSLTMQNKKV